MKFNPLFILLIALGLYSCDAPKKEKPQPPEEAVSITEVDTTIIDSTEIEEIIQLEEVTTLPFFQKRLEDDDFKVFYDSLVKGCRELDSNTVLNLISDTLRFSQYECAADFVQWPQMCDGCIGCSKEGMFRGVFGTNNMELVCAQLYELIIKFGVGPYDNTIMGGWLDYSNAYSNFQFTNSDDNHRFFEYEMILPLNDQVNVLTSADSNAKALSSLPFSPIPYSQDVGMGSYNEEESKMYLEYESGYIDETEVLTTFGYTIVLFEKRYNGWKITGFFQPPGC